MAAEMINEGRQTDPKYVEWRAACWTRDKQVCQICGKPGKEVHHIASYANAPGKRYLVSNGITLCQVCHSQTASYFNPKNNTTNISYKKELTEIFLVSATSIPKWIKLHLNLIFSCTFIVSMTLCILGVWTLSIYRGTGTNFILGSTLILLGLLFLNIICGWILHQKGRSVANLLLLLSPIIGWIILLFAILENRQVVPDDKNWFRRHLDWTFLLTVLQLLAIVFIAGALTTSTTVNTIRTGAIWTFFIICGPVSCWILNQKGKSMWNIFWVLLPLIGSIIFLVKVLGDNNSEDNEQSSICKYTKLLEADPDDAGAYQNRGLAYYKKGEYDKAIADYTRVIELDPQLAVAYNNRGLAYYKDDAYAKGIADFNKAIELNPIYSEAYHNRGNAYDRRREDAKAKDDKRKAKELGHR
jgi:tetratricopeptide (TPR) repeat protein